VGRSARSVSLRVLGCGDAFGSGGRSHTCFFLDAPSTKLVIDFGASALVSMNRFGIDPGAIDAIVVSHLHGDHFAGLPFLLLDAMFMTRRTRPLLIAGPRGISERVHKVCDAMFPGTWDHPKQFALEFLEYEDGHPLAVAGADVTPYPVIHDSGAQAYALRVSCDGCTVAYSGDTAWTDTLIDTARDADIFLCEATTFSKPIPNHLTYRAVVAKRKLLTAKRIVLTHLGPDVLARRKTLTLTAARDGQLFVLKKAALSRRRPR
jgi:ribonuclease BN (tRNA processing enzyme)